MVSSLVGDAGCVLYVGNTGRSGFIRKFFEKSRDAVVRDGLEEVFPRLWRYCVALTGRRDLGDDLAQTTCARALEKAHLFDPSTHLDRWMFRMAQRVWLNEMRAARLRAVPDAVDAEDAAAILPSTETNILARQVLDKVMDLPEAQRMAVLLVYVEGYKYSEAAEALDVPIGTIMSRLATARRKLAEQTGETPGGAE